ncbi:unnamed protein product, partial [Sphagnum jensenii]
FVMPSLTSASTGGAFSFANLPTSSATTLTPTTVAAASTASTMPASAAGTRGALTTSAAKTPKPPSEVVGKTVEEIIKEWTHELQERTSKFRKQAEALGEWDRRIITNRNLLIKLESEVAKVVESQHSLERQLELIETHQQEIEKSLESMEDEAERIYRDERPTLVEDEAAATRDMMYEQAEFVERELERMGEKIKETIQNINAAQGGDLEMVEGASPLDLVVRILNNQLTSLMWIDEKAGELSGRIQSFADQGAAHDKTYGLSRLQGA